MFRSAEGEKRYRLWRGDGVELYLMVMISPGLALMFQLQLILEGYWKGQPGLVITPLDALICSATSPQAGHTHTNTDRRAHTHAHPRRHTNEHLK